MTTVENVSGPVFVGTPVGEFALTNAGAWHFGEVSYVSYGVGGLSNLNSLRDGAVVVVDVGGRVFYSNGPDLVGSVSYGFGLAILTVGMVMGLKWVFRRLLAAGGLVGGLNE